MATTLTLQSLYGQIADELDVVRNGVRLHWTEAFQLVYGPSAAPPRLGGKMLRPALCLLSAGAVGGKSIDHFTDMGVAMELLHLAALAHDDVVDSARMRRGETSLNALWDNHTAVLGGDFLVARALTVLTSYDNCSVIASALESIHQMAEGELINFGVGKENWGEEDCLRLAKKKTASLFAVACSTPTLLNDETHREPLFSFGMGLGTAFQIVDDVLDLTQEEAVLGKPSCGDLVEGKTTLPILFLKEALDASGVDRLVSMAGQEPTPADRSWVAEQVRATGTQEYCDTLARHYLAEARQALSLLPPSGYIESMLAITEFVLIRES